MADEFGVDVWAEWSARNGNGVGGHNQVVSLAREFLERKYGEAAKKLVVSGHWNVRRCDVKELVKYINDADLDDWVVQQSPTPTLEKAKQVRAGSPSTQDPAPAIGESTGTSSNSARTVPAEDDRSDTNTITSPVVPEPEQSKSRKGDQGCTLGCFPRLMSLKASVQRM
ncbi:hypothetical protein M427DRAFT_34324 [Gonapodya prolifera JEL478]|uniref:Uncharacterized protein n=1 Tax=Gonapodya prolifera (strain JEL478) TaxID=1344416 RepID=A0A139A8T6_GONPJ|nr:hypothetical protein M427DRAFT_34324 [Gonapodya prolifera JEL478]|eukprot:KXS13098.1 hypothetical protein M427DRAFT_34324 [Gonapodya prolifera JEL478]